MLPCVVPAYGGWWLGGRGGEHHLVCAAVPVAARDRLLQHKLDEVQPEETNLLVYLDQVVRARGSGGEGRGIIRVLNMSRVGPDISSTSRQPNHTTDSKPSGTGTIRERTISGKAFLRLVASTCQARNSGE